LNLSKINENQKLKNYEILKENNDLITYTPAGLYDDSFILEFAMNLKGLILSNDKFEDKQFVENIIQ